MKSFNRKLLHRLEYIFVRILIFVLYPLPYRTGVNLGKILGTLAFYLDSSHRKIAISNLCNSFKNEKSEREIHNIAKRLFQNLGKMLIEFIWLSGKKREMLRKKVKVDKRDIDRIKKNVLGGVMITPHFGNWELLGSVVSCFIPSMIIAFPQSNTLTDKLINKIRSDNGIVTVNTGISVKEVIKGIKNGINIGFIADQDAGDNGIFVDFMGKSASTYKGPIAIAFKTGAPVMMVFMIREKDDSHKIVITEELKLERTGNEEKDIIVNTKKWTNVLEEYVKQYPDQWFWVHRRWKTQPTMGTVPTSKNA